MADAVRDRRPGFRSRHGLFLLLCPLARSPRPGATATRCRVDPPTRNREKRPAPNGSLLRRILRDIAIADCIRWLSAWGVSSVGKARQLRLLAASGQHAGSHGRYSAAACFWSPSKASAGLSRAGAGLHRAIGPIGVDVERTRGAFDHLAGDHDLFHALQARKIE